ncbi:MAG: hypothetical protein K1000chlam4_00009 [Chlamydiae bacterium]|nr:hypothetical protein [Chlamydiota bacterium]
MYNRVSMKKHLEAIDPNPHLVDRHQNFWHLAVIQGASFGVPALTIMGSLSDTYGAGTTFNSICIGNLILWIIGLATVAMAFSERKNAIQNLIDYIGKPGSILGGLVLLLAFLFWYSLQLRGTMSAMSGALQQQVSVQNGFDIRVGTALGLFVALLSLGGIRLIRWTAVVAFPFLMAFLLYALFMKSQFPVFKGTWGISIHAIAVVIATPLPGVVNLPTFFRHSRSRAHAFFALTLLTIFIICIEGAGILLGSGLPKMDLIFAYLSFDFTNLIITILFILMSLVCINLVNIYFVSAAWAAMLPRIGGAKEFAIVGMVGTIAFTFFQARDPLYFIENVLDGFIACLGITILMAYLVRRIVNHRERGFEKLISGLCWLIGCITVVYMQSWTSLQSSIVFFSGIGASGLAFLLFIFVEETIWSFMNCVSPTHKLASKK